MTMRGLLKRSMVARPLWVTFKLLPDGVRPRAVFVPAAVGGGRRARTADSSPPRRRA